ncbi:MAG: T9SS type A sorting domain-containing protein [Candidatus Cloacimonetes bacterium]|nr:T9SS type A sorting domain-containing protein [Candidatus Cloacimonadota bacterium]
MNQVDSISGNWINMKYFTVIFIIVISFNAVIACTIGVASGDVTSNGRPLIWKTRDIAAFPDNFLAWDNEADIGFLYVRDFRDSLAWMGMNEKGFCIVNSYVEREIERPIFNNGALMFHLLGHCATIEEMDTLLDTLNISEQVLSGNFAVIDSTGAAALYEISWTEVDKYDVADSGNGFLIRTNFSLLSGGSDGIERYQRSLDIISGLVEENILDAEHLMQEHFRDFSDDLSVGVSVPYEGRWLADRPWGYIKSNVSIARGIAASSIIMEGVLPSEKAETTTMYTLLGNPAVSVFLPLWATGSLPQQVTGETTSEITESANFLKNLVFNYSENSYYLDSYDLIEPGHTRLWDLLLPFENEMRVAVAEFLPEWRNGNLTADNAELLSEEWAYLGKTLLDSLAGYTSQQVLAEFSVSNNYGGYPLSVYFEDRSLHYPTSILWDFTNDGIYEVTGTSSLVWVYEDPGIYSVKLLVTNSVSVDEILLEDIVQVNQTASDNTSLATAPLILGNFPNPFRPGNQRHYYTEICFYLSGNSNNLSLDIFNQRGQKVLHKEFADTLQAGINSWNWDGKDARGKFVSNGVYLYKLTNKGLESETGKLTIIK